MSFCLLLSNAINAYLRLDPESDKRMKHLQGKVITIEIMPFHLLFQLSCLHHGVSVTQGEQHPSDAKITGTLMQLFGMALAKKGRQNRLKEGPRFEGDISLGQDILALFDECHIDWEEALSQYIGDIPAHHGMRLLKKVGAALQNINTSFTDSVQEYLHEEVTWFPSREMMNDFLSDVDQLRHDVDRLEVKMIRWLSI